MRRGTIPLLPRMVFEGADSAAHGADTAPKRLLPPTSSASTIQRHCNAGPAQSLRRGLKRRAVAAAGCRNQVTHVHQQKRARDALPSDECGRWGKRAVGWEGGRPAALRRVVAEQSHTSGLLLEVHSSSNSVRPSSQRDTLMSLCGRRASEKDRSVAPQGIAKVF